MRGLGQYSRRRLWRGSAGDEDGTAAVGWAAVGAALTFAVVGILASWLHRRSRRRLMFGTGLMVVAAAAGYWAASENYSIATATSGFGAGPGLPIALVITALVGAALAGGLLGAYRRPVAGPAWGALLTGIVVGGATGAWASTATWPLWQQIAAVSGAALAASIPWCVVMLNNHHRRERQIPPDEPVEPLTEGPGSLGGLR